jgi:hypothetical protein
MITRRGIRIIQSYDCIDLRTVTSQSSFLQEEIRKHRLQSLDAVLYTNALLTRFRMVMNLNGCGVLVIPEIDEMSNHSLYLRISEKMSALSGINRVRVQIDDISHKIKERIQRQEQREAIKVELKKAS